MEAHMLTFIVLMAGSTPQGGDLHSILPEKVLVSGGLGDCHTEFKRELPRVVRQHRVPEKAKVVPMCEKIIILQN